MKSCAVPHCENVLKPKARSRFCQACRAGFYYWGHKSPVEVINRQHKLTVYQDRLKLVKAKR